MNRLVFLCRPNMPRLHGTWHVISATLVFCII